VSDGRPVPICEDLRRCPRRPAGAMVWMMFPSCPSLDETCETESHELDLATCRWLLATERVGRLLVLAPERVVVHVDYAVVRDTVVVRVDDGPYSDACRRAHWSPSMSTCSMSSRRSDGACTCGVPLTA
jgi:hypothetical protein